eukprot:12936013-Prorocentrum_lima.AAC.1
MRVVAGKTLSEPMEEKLVAQTNIDPKESSGLTRSSYGATEEAMERQQHWTRLSEHQATSLCAGG